MIVEPVKLDATQYTVHYELLRSQVLGTAGDVARGSSVDQPRGVGLALLLSEGMPGWHKTVEAVLRASLPRAVDSSDPAQHEDLSGHSTAPVWLPSMRLHEVTTLLASLVLSTRPVAHESSREGRR